MVYASSKQSSVREQLERQLAVMLPGEPMPAERELSASLNVARMTLRRAVDALVAEGRLVRKQGAGTFVAPRLVDQRLSATSFSQDMRERGMEPGGHTLSTQFTTAEHDLADRLDVEMGHVVLHVRRLRTADGAPMAVEDLHVPSDLVPGLTGSDLEGLSFYDLLATRFGSPIASGTQTAEAVIVDAADAASLQVVQGAPAFLFERVSRLADGRVIEYVRSVYPGSRYRIVADIFPGPPHVRAVGR
ncbi:MAG: GntR family transcriptional regulator [Ornithinimicrobium sp.]